MAAFSRREEDEMAEHVQAHMVVADDQGNIFDDPYLLMVGRRGSQWGTPRPDELIPLPPA